MSLTRLPVLVGRCLGGADAGASSADLGAARRGAVGVVHTAAGDELSAVSSADILGAGVVGGEGQSSSGDCNAAYMSVGAQVMGSAERGACLQARTVAMVKRILMMRI